MSSDGLIRDTCKVTVKPSYTLSVKATGSGVASYSGVAIRDEIKTFSVLEGSSAIVSFVPDTGNRIKSVKLDGTDVTANITSNQYTIDNISANTSLDVEFEATPYMLSIKATGSGTATYNGTAIRSKTSSFIVTYGSSATVSFIPDDGYRIKSVKLNHIDVTSGVENFRYTINKMDADVSLEVEFEEMPPTVYALNVVASGNGTVSYDGNTIRNQSRNYSIIEGSTIVLSISPDNGYRIAQVL